MRTAKDYTQLWNLNFEIIQPSGTYLFASGKNNLLNHIET
jgi:hypothetical protein